MKNRMNCEELEKFLLNYISEPKSVVELMFREIKTYLENNKEFFVEIEKDGTIKINYIGVSEKKGCTIKMDQSLRKNSLIYEFKKDNQRLSDTDYYEQKKFNLSYVDNGWNNEAGYVIDTEKRVSQFNRQQGDSFGKIEDTIYVEKRFFDENGIEVSSNYKVIYYPDREQQYKFTFGLPEFNTRTPSKYYESTSLRTGFNTMVKYSSTSDIYGNVKKNETEYYTLNIERGRNVRLSQDFLISEERHNEMLTGEIDDQYLYYIDEPARTAMLEKYGVTNNKRR